MCMLLCVQADVRSSSYLVCIGFKLQSDEALLFSATYTVAVYTPYLAPLSARRCVYVLHLLELHFFVWVWASPSLRPIEVENSSTTF